MNCKSLIERIQESSEAIRLHQRQLHQASQAISNALIFREPYVYALPIVAFLLGLRYSEPCSKVLKVKHLYTYGLMLLPLLKE